MQLNRFLPLFSALAVILSCEKAPEPESETTFRVSVTQSNAFSLQISVSHDWDEHDSYCCFAAKGEVKNIDNEIDRFLSNTDKDVLSLHTHSQRKCVFKVFGLEPQTKYTVIVFGYSDGVVNRKRMATITGYTSENTISATLNPNWGIRYEGYVQYQENDFSLITVNVTGGAQQRFFLATYSKSVSDSFSSIESLLTYSADLLEEKLFNNPDYVFEASEIRTESTYFYRRLSPGDYVSYAVGINTDGTITGSYVSTGVYHVDKYPYDDGYLNMLDKFWRITDSYGKVYHVFFEEAIQNKYLYMYNWGGFLDMKIAVKYNRSDKSLEIDSQGLGHFDHVELSSGSTSGYVYLRGAYYNQDGKLMYTNSSNLELAKAVYSSGLYTFKTNYMVNFDDGTYTMDTGMMYIIKGDDGSTNGFARMMFPFSMQIDY